ncbi:hypothetical protein CQW23_17603 [Capsicum baccatum]|uniref:Uncharacterized protein n=1 Tax=Capsicum baccatum TaxID=33114 RepID=A0A2G2WEB8_CAPBA|nr:hypothetical protein CQW23_17603 [Capsicum baccatum]
MLDHFKENARAANSGPTQMMKAISQSKMFVLGTITSMHGYLASLEITNMASASDVDIGELVYEPLRSGPTLWEIGIPDCSAAEF